MKRRVVLLGRKSAQYWDESRRSTETKVGSVLRRKSAQYSDESRRSTRTKVGAVLTKVGAVLTKVGAVLTKVGANSVIYIHFLAFTVSLKDMASF